MISEEKMTHIVHLLVDGIWKSDLVDYSDEDAAMRESKRVALQYLQQLQAVGDIARKRIMTQKNPPMENTPQWEVLFQKYYDEEMAKHGV
jgi:uncharacterized protein